MPNIELTERKSVNASRNGLSVYIDYRHVKVNAPMGEVSILDTGRGTEIMIYPNKDLIAKHFEFIERGDEEHPEVPARRERSSCVPVHVAGNRASRLGRMR